MKITFCDETDEMWPSFFMGKGVAGHVAATGEVVILPDVAGDERWFKGIDEKTGFTTRSMVAVPVRGSVTVVLLPRPS